MLRVHQQNLLGRSGVLRIDVVVSNWSRLNNGYPVPGYRRRYRGRLRVLPNSYCEGGTMGTY